MWEEILIVLSVIVIVITCMRAFNANRGLIKYDEMILADLPNKKKSKQILKQIENKLHTLINYCIKNHSTNSTVLALKQNFQKMTMQETSKHDSGTSYTIDKKNMHLCLRDKQTGKHHQFNVLLFVSIHELAHVMSVSFGHNTEFNKNFKFLLQQAVNCGIYKPEDYAKNPKHFCGIIVHNSP